MLSFEKVDGVTVKDIKKIFTKMTSIRGISQLVSEAEKVLGPNTVFVITPDNGGSVWSDIFEIIILDNVMTLPLFWNSALNYQVRRDERSTPVWQADSV